MNKAIGFGVGILVVVAGWSAPARAQMWGYPFGYNNYGWSQWGANPQAGYMAGLGAYARGAGEYQLNDAKARQASRHSITEAGIGNMIERFSVRWEGERKLNRTKVRAIAGTMMFSGDEALKKMLKISKNGPLNKTHRAQTKKKA